MNIYCDCEVYANYFLVSFKNEKGKILHFEKYTNKKLDVNRLRRILYGATIITFNGTCYDLPILNLALSGASCREIKTLSNKIINDKIKPWDIDPPRFEGIDLIHVAPGKSSLKMYGARLNAKTIQDLPIEPTALISLQQRIELKKYCENDLALTQLLHKKLSPELKLRESIGQKYNVNVMSKSDQKIGEIILRNHLVKQNVNVFKPKTIKSFRYNIPHFIEFRSEKLNKLLDILSGLVFEIGESGRPILPDALKKPVEFAGKKYKIGIGGLHSQEKKQVVKPTEFQNYGEFDVTSMYPSIIIGSKLYPKHLDKVFVKIYKSIFDIRLRAKKKGDKLLSDTYKLILNSAFGKFGSKYSFLYSPKLLTQVTITGQLTLLMLIEMITDAGGEVISANTDGINVLCNENSSDLIGKAAFEWELMTGYNLEYTPYLASYSRDVNNYIMIKADRETKEKGYFAEGSLMKNFANLVCLDAAKEFIKNGKNYKKHIKEELDITKFLSIRLVTGGATWRDIYLGKVVRWYYSIDGNQICYKKNDNKVPKTDGCRPMMTLINTIPEDLDYERYYKECEDIIVSLGIEN